MNAQYPFDVYHNALTSEHRIIETFRQASAQLDNPFVANFMERVVDSTHLGTGAEKLVYVHPDDEQKAVSLVYEGNRTPDNIKRNFYLTKVAHLLAPNQIPDMHLASWALPLRISERVIPPAGLRGCIANASKFVRASLLVRKLDRLGILVDDHASNFVTNQLGSVSYVDNVYIEYGLQTGKVERAVQSLAPANRQRALRYLKRAQQLQKPKDH
jgi:hypothetical protein